MVDPPQPGQGGRLDLGVIEGEADVAGCVAGQAAAGGGVVDRLQGHAEDIGGLGSGDEHGGEASTNRHCAGFVIHSVVGQAGGVRIDPSAQHR